MSNERFPEPFMEDPPAYNKLVTEDGFPTKEWINWINRISPITGLVIVHDFLVNALTGERYQEVGLLMAPRLTEAQRDQLDTKRNGTIIYNTTTDKYNFRAANAWVPFP